MTLIEAIKSGKRYKIEGYLEWYVPNLNNVHTISEILSNNWIIEQEKTILHEYLVKIFRVDGLCFWALEYHKSDKDVKRFHNEGDFTKTGVTKEVEL